MKNHTQGETYSNKHEIHMMILYIYITQVILRNYYVEDYYDY